MGPCSRNWITIFFFFGAQLLAGQSPESGIDRLFQHGLNLEKPGLVDSSRMVLHQALALALAENRPDDAIQIQEALTFQSELFHWMDSLRADGLALKEMALRYGKPASHATAMLLVADYFLENFKYPLALEHCQRAEEISDSLNDPRLIALSRFFQGTVLRVIHNDSKSPVPYFEEAFSLFHELRDTVFMIRTALVLASGLKNADQQQWYISRAIRWAEALKSRPLKMRVWVHRAAYIPPEEAIPYLEEALRISRMIHSAYWTQHCYVQLSNRYQTLGRFEQALDLLDSALVAHPGGLAANGAYNRYSIYRQKGEYEKAQEYLDQALQWEDERHSKEIRMLVSEWESRFNTQNARNKLIQKEAELKVQTSRAWLLFILLVAMTAAFFLGILGFQYQRSIREKLESQNALVQQQKEELDRFYQSRDRFFNNLAHELRTPLTLILGPIPGLLNNPDLSPEMKDQLQISQQQGHKMLHLVNQLLELGKLDFGHTEVHYGPIRLYSFLDHVVHSFSREADSKRIDLSFRYLAEPDLFLELDAEKLETILSNLLSNALKFTPKKGLISLTVKDNSMSGKLRIEVSDTGIGIPSEELPHIFDRFFQSGGMRNSSGTGIGLSYAKELVVLLGGRIWAESRPGQGSTFFLELPRRPLLQSIRVNTAPPLKTETEHPAILLVEDNADLRQFLGSVLSGKYRVRYAGNGQEALDILGAEDLPDLLLTDLMMPVMDGLQLIKTLREDARLKLVPVMIITARSSQHDILQALRLGVQDYLTKPFSEKELLGRIGDLMNRFGSPKPARPGTSGTPAKPSAGSPGWHQQLREIVERRLGEFDLKAEDVAAELGMSRTQFFRQMKSELDTTPSQYLEKARFQRAMQLLQTGKAESVKALAFEVGFRQVGYFSRRFKAHFGKSPSEFLSQGD